MDFVSLARDFKYRKGRGNLSLQNWNEIKSTFNPNLPIRPSDKWSPREYKELNQDLQIFLSHLAALIEYSKSDQDCKEYLDLFMNWSESNNSDTVKSMKSIEKRSRLSSDSYVKQSLLTFHRAYNYKPSEEVFNQDFADYVDYYMADEKFMPEVESFSFETKKLLLENLLRNVNRIKEYRMPSVSMSKSPIGDKKNDFRNITKILAAYDLPEEVASNMDMLNKACSLLNIPVFEFRKSSKRLDQIDPVAYANVTSLCPKLMLIPNPGKLRTIFISNDIYDVILDPFRNIIRMLTKGLSSSYNSKKVTKDEYLNVDIPDNIRQTYESSLNTFNSSLVNSDLSSATDKIYCQFQNKLLIDIIDLLEAQSYGKDKVSIIETVYGISNLREYCKTCLDIISMSYISFSYRLNNVDNYGLVLPKFGQCQGQRGSFDLLHLTHTAVCLEACYKFDKSIKLDPNNLPFLVNGDDGVFPEVIEDIYSKIWIRNSDEGIKSEDKSSSTSSDYVEFCKQYVRFSKNSRQPLNGLRFPTLVKMLSNPSVIMQMEERYDTSDLWKQIRLLYSSMNKEGVYLPIGDTQIMSIPDGKRSELLRVRSVLLEIASKHAIQMSSVPQYVELIKDAVDNSSSCFNVFDRERLLPTEEHSDAYDWVDKMGLIAISNKFGLSVEGFISFNVDKVAYDHVVLGSPIPPEIVVLASRLDANLYKELAGDNIIPAVQLRRRTAVLEMEWSITPHRLLIAPTYIGKELLFG